MGMLLNLAANIYLILFIVRWVVDGLLPQHANTGWYLRIKDVTEPVLTLIRKYVPSLAGIDFSYIIAMVGIKIVVKLVIHLL